MSKKLIYSSRLFIMARLLLTSSLFPLSKTSSRSLLVPVWTSISSTRVNYTSAADVRVQRVTELLKKELNPTELEVIDHSGGCDGGTLEIRIASDKFKGASKLKQHRTVNTIMKEELKNLHALVLRTSTPKE